MSNGALWMIHCAPRAKSMNSAAMSRKQGLSRTGATPNPRSYAIAAARIAGWRRSSTAASRPRAVRIVTRTPGGAIAATCRRSSASISSGSWSGTRRRSSFARARAATTFSRPSPW